MHQSHNTPWDTFAKHFKPKQTFCDCGKTDCYSIFLTSRARIHQQTDLEHLCRKTISSIRDFSKTEKAKFPTDWPLDEDVPNLYIPATFFTKHFDRYPGAVYQQELLSATSSGVTTRTLEQWTNANDDSQDRLRSQGHLANLPKLLLDAAAEGNDDALRHLLVLVRHPGIRELMHHDQSHAWGWDTVGTTALHSYVLLNLCGVAFSGSLGLGRGVVGRLDLFRHFWQDTLGSKDNNMQIIPHLHFFQQCFNEPDASLQLAPVDLRDCGFTWNHGIGAILDVFSDRNRVRLKAYLKKCWRLMYLCDTLMEEVGRIEPGRRERAYGPGDVGIWEDELSLFLRELGVEVDREKLGPRNEVKGIVI